MRSVALLIRLKFYIIMQILLSCAKDMVSTHTHSFSCKTSPRFQENAVTNAQQMAEFTSEELSKMLKINPQLASLNALRYQQFLDPSPLLPAALSYDGIAYKHLKASQWNEEGLLFARNHLFITSFLYGLLRPTDLIKNYRLEGNVVLPDNEKSMFDYWKPLLTDYLIDTTMADDGILVNLASAEMKRLFDWKKVTKHLKVIQPDFMVEKLGALKSVVVYAKMCRGAMTNYIIKNKIKEVEALKQFSFEGFNYHSGEENLCFVQM